MSIQYHSPQQGIRDLERALGFKSEMPHGFSLESCPWFHERLEGHGFGKSKRVIRPEKRDSLRVNGSTSSHKRER